jgi:Neuraminidase (sialidase)
VPPRRKTVWVRLITTGVATALCAGAIASSVPAVQAATNGFVFGIPNAGAVGAPGCGSNSDGEPAIRVSPANNVVMASERGLGSGTDAWHAVQPGGTTASACALRYGGQPNAVSGAGASGGDVDVAIASTALASGAFRAYVSSLNGGSVAVAHSDNNGATWTNIPVQAGLPGDDREWLAAFGASTSLLTFHDIATQNIDVLRSDNGGIGYTEIAQAISPTSTAAQNGAIIGNELGNVAIDRRNLAGTKAGPAGRVGFWAYQPFVSGSSTNAAQFNEAYLAVSNDGGFHWADRPVPCSTAAPNVGLGHAFPNVSVDPAGNVWLAWSAGVDDANGFNTSGRVITALSRDHGSTWSCSQPIATGQSIQPWLASASGGVDLVFYKNVGTTAAQSWAVELAQNAHADTAPAVTGWSTPQLLTVVHHGGVCEAGATCTSGRQLFDDFGVAVDMRGDAHIAYSHDASCSQCTYTGYAVQTAGTTIGQPG